MTLRNVGNTASIRAAQRDDSGHVESSVQSEFCSLCATGFCFLGCDLVAPPSKKICNLKLCFVLKQLYQLVLSSHLGPLMPADYRCFFVAVVFRVA
jgi:hypothetical protein